MDVVGKKDIVAVLLPKKETSQQPEDNFQSLSGSTSSESQPGTPSRGKELGYSISFILLLQDCLINSKVYSGYLEHHRWIPGFSAKQGNG